MSDVFYVIGEDTAKSIADSIRTKRGYTADHLIKVEDYNDEIDAINSSTDEIFSASTPDNSLDLVLGLDGELRSNSFKDNVKIKSLSCPNLKTVGANAFQNCSNLKTVDLPEVVTINNYGFNSCPITSFNAPKVKTIGSYNLGAYRSSIFQNDSVESLGDYNFSGNNYVTKISCANLKTMGGYIANNSTTLKEVDCPELTSIGTGAFRASNSYGTAVAIESLNVPKLQTLGAEAFRYAYKLKRINSDVDGEFNFPELTTLLTYNQSGGYTYGYQFDGVSSMRVLRVPKLVNAGYNAFSSCGNLEEIYVNNSLTTMFPFSTSKIKRINSDVDGVINLPGATNSSTDLSNLPLIRYIYLPNFTTALQFKNNAILELIDCGKITSANANWLNDCPNLTGVILRHPSTVLPFQSGSMAGTTVPSNITFYVPTNLVASYEASDWHTVKGITIAPLVNQLTVGVDTFDCIAGESWSSWVASENNTDGYIIVGNIIMDSTKTNYITQNGSAVLPGQVINGTAYELTTL